MRGGGADARSGPACAASFFLDEQQDSASAPEARAAAPVACDCKPDLESHCAPGALVRVHKCLPLSVVCVALVTIITCVIVSSLLGHWWGGLDWPFISFVSGCLQHARAPLTSSYERVVAARAVIRVAISPSTTSLRLAFVLRRLS